jgi:hypothetical protein
MQFHSGVTADHCAVNTVSELAVVGAESDVGTLFYCSQTCQHLECYEAECLGILFLLGLPFVCI